MSESTEKPHDASQKKLDDARLKGEIIRAPELNTAMIYCAFFAGFSILGAAAATTLMHLTMDLWTGQIGAMQLASNSMMIDLLRSSLIGIAPELGTLFMLLPLSVLAINIVMRGVIFTGSNIVFKANRISPIAGVKNKFGPTGLFEFSKGLIKSGIIVFLITYLISPSLSDLPGFAQIPHGPTLLRNFDTIGLILLYLSIISLGLAALDYAWQRHRFLKKNMMSFQELKEESKEAEGDPHLKSARRQKGMELTSSQLQQAVADADVVIVNPTHFAVALVWDPTQADAPIISAIGLDHRALHIKKIATDHNTPIYVDIPTARTLATTMTIGDTIPYEHFAAVAAAIRFAQQGQSKVGYA